jgi:amidophosphoribosyltransferase
MAAGYTFCGPSDAELLLALINTAMAANLEDAVEEALQLIEGAYSLLILSKAHLIGAKDPWGIKPLAVGQLGEDAMLGENSIVFASESSAFDLLGAKFLHELEAGEMLIQGPAGTHSRFVTDRQSKRPCIFELVHFARPDSFMLERTVMAVRREWGRLLALRHPVSADIVVPVPDSGVRAALGYSEQSGIQLDFGIVRSHYAGRKYSEPKQGARNFGEKMKLNPVRETLKDRRVVLVDDCVASGATSKKLVGAVRAAGAKEVHLRISSPPIAHNCFYGVGGPTREHLATSQGSIDEIKDFIGADTLAYLDIEDMQRAIEDDGGKGACYACFNGDCPIQIG